MLPDYLYLCGSTYCAADKMIVKDPVERPEYLIPHLLVVLILGPTYLAIGDEIHPHYGFTSRVHSTVSVLW